MKKNRLQMTVAAVPIVSSQFLEDIIKATAMSHCFNLLFNGHICPPPLLCNCNKGGGVIRVIPQGTVDNNLGPDRLVGPKALDPNYCRQPTL